MDDFPHSLSGNSKCTEKQPCNWITGCYTNVSLASHQSSRCENVHTRLRGTDWSSTATPFCSVSERTAAGDLAQHLVRLLLLLLASCSPPPHHHHHHWHMMEIETVQSSPEDKEIHVIDFSSLRYLSLLSLLLLTQFRCVWGGGCLNNCVCKTVYFVHFLGVYICLLHINRCAAVHFLHMIYFTVSTRVLSQQHSSTWERCDTN